jgi:hypothetical protein
MRPRSVALVLPVFLLLSLPLRAQQTGASITGHVTDASGAAIAEAKIVITSTTTGSVYSTESDSAGIYRIPFAAIGEYTLTAEKTGFQTYVQKGLTLIVDQKVTVDVQLKLGAVSQSVTVTADAALLQTESADRGFTDDPVRLENGGSMAGMNTMQATLYAPGMAFSNSSDYSGSMSPGTLSNGGMSGGISNGGIAGNNYMVDGVTSGGPARGGTITQNGDAWNPIEGSVQEVSVSTTMYDAQYGWSSGAVVNTITKSGTNTWHGSAYEHLQNTAFDANSFTNNWHGLPISPLHGDIYGFNGGGAIKKNKLFVFGAYEKVESFTPNSFTTAVPTAAERQGNFSGLYTSSAKTSQITIYDPNTTTLCPAAVAWCTGVKSGTYARESFSAEYGTNNTIPSTMVNSIAANTFNLIPLPNAANGYNDNGNFINQGQYREQSNIMPEGQGRVDLDLSEKTHAFFRYSMLNYLLYKGFDYSTPSYNDPADVTIDDPLIRETQSYALQIVRTINPTTVVQFRTGMTRYITSPGGGGEGANFNLSSLGFSSTFQSQAQPWFPKFNWSGYAGAGTVGPTGFQASPTWDSAFVFSKTRGKHNLRFGFQNYVAQQNILNPGSIAGNFSFTGDLTTANPTSQTAATGNGIADFVLGDPASGYITVQLSPAYTMRSYSLFGQDDYHISRNLTLNLGLRWDYQGTVTERHNGQLGGFCTTCASPLQVPGLTLLGGPLFTGVAPNPRGIFNPKYNNFGPRVGFAYSLRANTVVRGGYGILYAQIFQTPGLAPGFSQNTNMLTSIQTGIPNPAVSLQDPFPTGVLVPVGSQFGLAANLGNSIAFADRDMNIPMTQQFSLEVQHQFGHNWLFTLGYVGTRGTRLPVTQSLDAIPLADLPYTYSFQTNPTGMTAAQLNSNVANPFTAVPSSSPYYSLINGTYLSPTASTITEYHLTYPFPQFSAVSEMFEPIGGTRYNALQAEFNKRLSNGLDFIFNYQYSKTMQAITFNNAEDAQPTWSIYPYDIHQTAKIDIIYLLPFGPGKQFLSSTSPVVSRLVEGWTWAASSLLMGGIPIAAPTGVMPTGASETVSNPQIGGYWFNGCTENAAGTATVNCPAGTTTPAWRTTVADQLVTWSPYLSKIRTPMFDEVEMSASKKTTIKEHYDLIFRADATNIFNSTDWMGGPDTNSLDTTFGTIGPPFSFPSNSARAITLSLTFKF